MLASVFLSINPFLNSTSAFILGMFLGVFVYFIMENVFSPPKKQECPKCLKKEKDKKEEEERLYKEWEEQQKGYKN